jgi:hypothetical protein
MKNATGRFLGGFHALAPFEKYSDIAPLLRKAYDPSPYSPSNGDAMPKIKQYLASYGIDQTFIKRIQTQKGPGVSMQPGQGN